MNKATSSVVEPQVAPELTGRRYVYNGEPQRPEFENIQRGNRPVRKRARSPFNVVIILFAISLVIVLYVWNKISVNRLAVEVVDYDAQLTAILHKNEILRAEISTKSTLERIERLASVQLGMKTPATKPVWFTFDDQRLSRLNQ